MSVNHHALPGVGRCAAGADSRPDIEAVDGLVVGSGEARGSTVAQPAAVPVQEEHRADHAGRDPLRAPGQLGQHVLEARSRGEELQDAALGGLDGVGLGQVGRALLDEALDFCVAAGDGQEERSHQAREEEAAGKEGPGVPGLLRSQVRRSGREFEPPCAACHLEAMFPADCRSRRIPRGWPRIAGPAFTTWIGVTMRAPMLSPTHQVHQL